MSPLVLASLAPWCSRGAWQETRYFTFNTALLAASISSLGMHVKTWAWSLAPSGDGVVSLSQHSSFTNLAMPELPRSRDR